MQQHSALFEWMHMSDFQCYKYCQGSGFEYAMVKQDRCYCTWQEDIELNFDEGYDDSGYDLWYDKGDHCNFTCPSHSGKSCGGQTDGYFVYNSGTCLEKKVLLLIRNLQWSVIA